MAYLGFNKIFKNPLKGVKMKNSTLTKVIEITIVTLSAVVGGLVGRWMYKEKLKDSKK